MPSAIREEIVRVALNKSSALIDYKVYNDIPKQTEFRKQIILDDKFLTSEEKTEAIGIINKSYDHDKILYNFGRKRICENCNQECLAILYCEFCVRNCLKSNFSNWSSGNDDIDNLIQKCQMETIDPERIIEWIPYDQFQNVNNYLLKNDSSDIYTAVWIDGCYNEWDPNEKRLKRFGRQKVILKSLENDENINRNWFEEAKSHLTLSNEWQSSVQYYGLTQDPSNGNYMLVMNSMDVSLREFLQQNHNQLSWKEKFQIVVDMTYSLYIIHEENAIHRDLHSGNILHSPRSNKWYINELGLSGPADVSSKSIYGNLPYIAPEVIAGKQVTKASNIYGIAMLMWEISSGQPPFTNREHDYNLANDIVNGMRPNIIPGTPLEYKSLMKQSWDADPLKRPDAYTLWKKLYEINLYYLNELYEAIQSEETNDDVNKKSANYTDAFRNKSYDNSDNIGFNKTNNQDEGNLFLDELLSSK
ncbi:kinase-like domain-containing protein [Rhizophagus irregularis DAOM 181602=DAOM 197198]|uniref:Kinase-like domain-containing protein n=1 Tax=Rhizophagus irregularis (strain DAOM 181602 / DAOM 197198 / MUCL 43194) TaxID=747089 RepID=A0A2P4Q5L0_RHIID|nr:kinase-like domain-containing protein [Rhizophagus irregularis DAOM 181602=DAOM 197198]POG72941.1 kinase-like domain-containing protein [Rhizophagus irregularis DAOM 181602=DAOM 197198]|eukprot:XP_025179807.1 kinase-like domain-containing protein [Rhizophagus irregularis DAOM 181602=DAOM 197198]